FWWCRSCAFLMCACVFHWSRTFRSESSTVTSCWPTATGTSMALLDRSWIGLSRCRAREPDDRCRRHSRDDMPETAAHGRPPLLVGGSTKSPPRNPTEHGTPVRRRLSGRPDNPWAKNGLNPAGGLLEPGDPRL